MTGTEKTWKKLQKLEAERTRIVRKIKKLRAKLAKPQGRKA